MKKILIIHTGGTIGSKSTETERAMNKDSVTEAKRLLLTNFFKSNSKYSGCTNMFEDAQFPEEKTTLSESMYPEKLFEITAYLNCFDFSRYDGIIVLHGTDTLAFTASLFSYLYSSINIPMILVSGNRPPDDELSNANVNFKTAIELIWEGIAPNVYAVYRNSDSTVRLFLGSTLMQCPNFSEDFRSASPKCVFELCNSEDRGIFETEDADMLERCVSLSDNRNNYLSADVDGKMDILSRALLIYPHMGLDYSVYSHSIENSEPSCFGVVHGTYHSGTVSLPGIVASCDDEMNSKYSILYLCKMCGKKNIPLYIAPSKLGKEQYETMSVLVKRCKVTLLNMTTESAFAKLLTALSYGLDREALDKYMETNICNEMLY